MKIRTKPSGGSTNIEATTSSFEDTTHSHRSAMEETTHDHEEGLLIDVEENHEDPFEFTIMSNAPSSVISTAKMVLVVIKYEVLNRVFWLELSKEIVYYLLVTIVTGLMFYQLGVDIPGSHSRIGYLLFCIAFIHLGSSRTTKYTLMLSPDVKRDCSTSSYITKAYNIAYLIMDTVFRGVIPSIIMSSNYYVIGLRAGFDHYIVFLCALILVSIYTTMLSYIIGLLTSNVYGYTRFFNIALIFNFLFSGLVANKASVPDVVRFVSVLSFWNQLYEMMMINEFKGALVNIKIGTMIDFKDIDGIYWLKELGMNVNGIKADIMLVIAHLTDGFIHCGNRKYHKAIKVVMSNDKFVLDTSNVGGKRTLEYKITKAILNSNDQTLTVKNINTKLSSETLDNKTKKLLFCIVANLLLTSISSELRDSIKNVYEIIYTDTNGSSISINRKYCFIGVGETVNLTIRCDALSDIKVRVNNKYTECEGSVGVVTFSVGTDSDSPIQVKNIDIYVGGQLRT
ncbi:hypothetical protein FDP41_009339 [Naegleria fowleri]|uniref:ABC-2 type transporter transmembrane domain-containing protein n=1 Tax=Naegleria fowleri TaxID=5763 RepID=A0A6A5BCM9_NAEFO|nr:uncharacterized protein FDP41_009339 [Naegleria fowleri]KAF0972436.1 hypothetical protein FDP41_009339 [Naegleria fowleri]